MEKSVLLSRVKAFVEALSASDQVGVLVHGDPDGLASGVMVSEMVQQKTGKKPYTMACSSYGNHALMEKKLDLYRFSYCNKLIVADLSFDQDAFFFEKAEEFLDALLFIDHHKVYGDFNSDKTVFVKASAVSDIDPSKYPASKLCFDLFSPLVPMTRVDWIAAVGILGDASGLQWKSFVEMACQHHKCSLKDLEDCKEIIEAVGLKEPFRFSELWNFFFSAETPKAVLDSHFASLLHEMRSEIVYWLERFEKEKEFLAELELVWFECRPHFPIKAPLVNKISFELHPNQTVVFVQDLDSEDGLISVSARRQDGKVRVNDLLEAAVKGIPGAVAGGHAPAAGGKLPRAFLAQFKQNVLAELKKQYST